MVLYIADSIDEPAVVGSAALSRSGRIEIAAGFHTFTGIVVHRATVCASRHTITGRHPVKGPESTITVALLTAPSHELGPVRARKLAL